MFRMMVNLPHQMSLVSGAESESACLTSITVIEYAALVSNAGDRNAY